MVLAVILHFGGVVIFRGLDKVEVADGNNAVVTFEFDRVV